MSLDKSEGMAGDDQKLNLASLEKSLTLDKPSINVLVKLILQ